MHNGIRRKMKVDVHNNFGFLTVALALLLFGVSLADELGLRLGQMLIQAAILVVLLVGIWSIQSKAHWTLTRGALVAVIVSVTLAGAFVEWADMDTHWLGMLLVYLVLTSWLAMKQVLFTGPIDGNKIIGAVCIFLLMGLTWTALYMIISLHHPDAFNGIQPGPWHEVFPDLVYFSFATLTTLGYGDIVPVAPIVRFLAYFEAVTGQFYIAVLVASLVGIRISRHQP
jgi:voltage-gated potassium channel